MQDFVKEFVRKHLDELSAEERLAGLKVEERLAGLKVEDRLAGLSEAQIEAVLHRRRRQQPAPKKRTPKKGR
jgi:hypothetical protein